MHVDKMELLKWLADEIVGCKARNETERSNAMRELFLKVDRGYFDAKTDYRELSHRFIGEYITDFFCNGFFDGGRNYDMEGAEIIGIRQPEESSIIVTVRKRDGTEDYGRFEDDWADWESVYKHLDEWVNGRREYHKY